MEHKDKKTKNELEECKKERDECMEGWKRAKADLENYKKEEETRVSGLVKFSLESLLKDMIQILDSFDAAIQNEEKSNGLQAIRGQTLEALKRHGVEEIKVGPGDEFDPAKHEAIGEVESEIEEGNVAEIIAKGYTLHEKILRAAQIKISKGQK